MFSDTIAAIATAVNNAGINIIRISGDESISIAYRLFKPKNINKDIRKVNSHTIHFGVIIDNDIVVDEVLLSIMKNPNSYTKEDVVEINCHGGAVITKKILDLVCRSGARMAEPGEFTKRAFLNGRIDLSQAEAVMDIINAKNEYAAASSVSQLRGNIHDEIVKIRDVIIHDIAFIEAALDDPEHIDIEGYSKTLYSNATNCRDKLKKIYDTADNGRIIKEGINTVIVGKPNAGKSSLLNLLVGEERAIVTDIAGTTRDILKEEININGIILNVIDTAGIRDTDDIVEKIGVNKSKEYIDKSDLVVYVVDASTELDDNDFEIINLIENKKCIVLLNKSDLKSITDDNEIKKYFNNGSIISVSAKNNFGIDVFENTIKNMFFTGIIEYNDQVIITNVRQKNEIFASIESLNKVLESIDNCMPEDFYSIDMMSAYESLGEVIGEAISDDLVNTIFKEFCMGK